MTQELEKLLIDNGYKKYIASAFYMGCVALYQKCVRDEVGKKYFIDFPVYNHPNQGLVTEAHVQFAQTFTEPKTGPTVNISVMTQDINKAEEIAEKIWQTLDKPYYEKYDD